LYQFLGPIINESNEDVTKSDEEVDEIGKQLAQHIIGLNPQTIEPKAGAEALGDDGPTPLLQQQFFFDKQITVSQYKNDSNIKVFDFIRFECGVNE
jgi:translation elongation factor EF-Ts